MRGKKYQVIYADPPWKYGFSSTKSRKIENQYPTMTVDEIKALSVPAEKNAVLYLWATAPKLLEALTVMKAWEFAYKTQAVWDKEKIGMGYWFRGQHEILLVGVKGKFSPPPQSTRVSSVFRIPRTRHSKKPDEIRAAIASWFPDKSRVELFARKQKGLLIDGSWEGWEVWGNEVESDVELVPTPTMISERRAQ